MAEPHIPPFADFGRWRGKRLLEIGCGLGTDTINFARAGAEVTAVEPVRRVPALARRAELFGLADRITFYHVPSPTAGPICPIFPSSFEIIERQFGWHLCPAARTPE